MVLDPLYSLNDLTPASSKYLDIVATRAHNFTAGKLGHRHLPVVSKCGERQRRQCCSGSSRFSAAFLAVSPCPVD